MPVVVMEVTEKSAHEKTDQLFIYTFACPTMSRARSSPI